MQDGSAAIRPVRLLMGHSIWRASPMTGAQLVRAVCAFRRFHSHSLSVEYSTLDRRYINLPYCIVRSDTFIMPKIVVDGEEESILDESEQTMRPKDVAVQQQRVYAWHPILDPEWMIYSFLILAVVMIPVGTLTFRNSFNESLRMVPFAHFCWRCICCSLSFRFEQASIYHHSRVQW